VSTYEHYTTPVPPGTWDVAAAGATRFCWEYDEGRDRLLSWLTKPSPKAPPGNGLPRALRS